MSGRNRKDVATVSLFPFLAVLICTMGILVVLLVLAVKVADVNAIENTESRAQHETQAELLQSQLDDEQLRVDSLQALRPDVIQKLSREREKRSLIKNEVRDLKERLAAARSNFRESQMAAQMEKLEEVSESEIENLQLLISETESLAGDLRESSGDGQTTYSIVPYSGASGSARKPIYIECTRDGLTIQPSGIRLSERDFTMPILPGNPLDAALLAVRQYQRRNNIEGDAGQAYPLLIVRPGGESNFALARRAMKSWDDEFGYELIEKEKELDFGVPDSLLTRELETVVNESLRKQARLAAVMQSRGQTFQKLATGRARKFSEGNLSGSGGLAASGFSQTSELGVGDKQASGTETGDLLQANGQTFSEKTNDGESQNELSEFDPEGSEPEFQESGTSGGSLASSQRISKFNSNRSSNSESNSSSQEAGNLKIGQASSQPVRPVSESRGSDWALPTSTSNAIAYRRPIRVTCGLNEIIVDPGRNSNLRKIAIPINDSIDDSVDPFVQSVWTVIESWGIAGSGGYWKPVLNIDVLNGGQDNHARLQALLRNSGLELE